MIFRRDPTECWINPYNKTLLDAWDANMDIQPVLDAYSCIMYVVSYISKAKWELRDLLKRAQQEASPGHLDPLHQLRQLGNIYLHHRDVSIMEAIYCVTGMNLKHAKQSGTVTCTAISPNSIFSLHPF